MAISSHGRTAAGAVVIALGIAIAISLTPFLMGLVGAPMLAVVFGPMYGRLATRVRPSMAATIVLVVALLVVMLPVLAIGAVLVDQLPGAVAGTSSSKLIASISTWRVGPFAVGQELARASGGIAAWASREALAAVGGATRVAINLLIAFLGLYYLLISGDTAWNEVARYIPFSRETTDKLRERFRTLTSATLLGIGVTAALQGAIVGAAFAIVGLDRPVLWGVVTTVVSVLPVFGSALVWLPATVVLVLDGRPGAAATMAILGAGIAANVDNVVRPIIFRRVSNINPVVTLVGAFAGFQYFGLLGVLLGPLALAYFFELVRAFEVEYLTAVDGG